MPFVINNKPFSRIHFRCFTSLAVFFYCCLYRLLKIRQHFISQYLPIKLLYSLQAIIYPLFSLGCVIGTYYLLNSFFYSFSSLLTADKNGIPGIGRVQGGSYHRCTAGHCLQHRIVYGRAIYQYCRHIYIYLPVKRSKIFIAVRLD